ncbi:MAG: hypothetical protein IT269_02560 [Saprospiraceae bacterium]|nr:hypothetical protein [Saprospiraceae bacterium]
MHFFICWMGWLFEELVICLFGDLLDWLFVYLGILGFEDLGICWICWIGYFKKAMSNLIKKICHPERQRRIWPSSCEYAPSRLPAPSLALRMTTFWGEIAE